MNQLGQALGEENYIRAVRHSARVEGFILGVLSSILFFAVWGLL